MTGVKRGVMVFAGIMVGAVVLSYCAFPVFFVLFGLMVVAWSTLCLWFMFFDGWLVSSVKADWTAPPVTTVVLSPTSTHSASANFKVLAGRQAARLSYAFSDDDEYAEVQASLKARR